MHFATSTDYPLLTWILTNPKCYAAMPADDAPLASDFKVQPMPGVRWVVAWVKETPIAAVMLQKVARQRQTLQLHFCVTPRAWGVSREIAHRFLNWLWRINRQLGTLVISVPGYNSLALRMAITAGFQSLGRGPSGRTKHGKPFDDYWFAMPRPKEFAT